MILNRKFNEICKFGWKLIRKMFPLLILQFSSKSIPITLILFD
jgi:hypothetical protein